MKTHTDEELEKADVSFTKTAIDIHSYIIFANVDYRDGNIKGHRMLLSDKKMELIEAVILDDSIDEDNGRLRLDENSMYELEDELEDELVRTDFIDTSGRTYH